MIRRDMFRNGIRRKAAAACCWKRGRIVPFGSNLKNLQLCLLDWAVNYGGVRELEKLLPTETKHRINARDPQSQDTILHDCARRGRADMVDLLLKYGADPNAQNISAKTPLFVACSEGRANVVRVLIAHRETQYHLVDFEGATPLVIACFEGHAECVEVLLEAGCCSADEMGKLGTPLHCASMRGHAQVVRILLRYGADVTATAGQHHLTPLDAAILEEHIEVEDILCDAMTPEQISHIRTNSKKRGRRGLEFRLGLCQGCGEQLPGETSQTASYMCKTCYEQHGQVRMFCQPCTLGPKQNSSRLCPGHVLLCSKPGSTSSRDHVKMELGQRNPVGVEREGAEWHSKKPLENDPLALGGVIRDLSIALFLKDKRFAVDVMSSTGVFSTDFEETLSLADAGLESHDLSEALERDLSSQAPSHHVQLVNWLTVWSISRGRRPTDELPSWLEMVFHDEFNLTQLVAWLIVGKLNAQEPGDIIVRDDKTVLTHNRLNDLPVAQFRAIELWKLPKMPEHGECQFADNPDFPIAGPTVQLFVSHKWHEAHHPDTKGDDWRSLRNFVGSSILGFVSLCHILREIGIDSTDMGVDSSLQWQLPNDTGYVDHQLSKDLLDLVASLMPRASSQNEDVDMNAIVSAVANRVFIWIDFVSLPQSISRERTEDERKWFKESLFRMGDIQQSMNTVIIDSDEDYSQRAWCTAEFLNAFDSYSCVKSSAEEPFNIGRDKLDRCVREMVGTETLLPVDVIKQKLGLKITNDSDSSTVCRIMWPRVCKILQTTSTLGTHSSRWTICSGSPYTVARYLSSATADSFSDFDETWLRYREVLHAEAFDIRPKRRTLYFLLESRVLFSNSTLADKLCSISTVIAESTADDNTHVSVITLSGEDTVPQESAESLVVAHPTSEHAHKARLIVNHSGVRPFFVTEQLPGGQLVLDCGNGKFTSDGTRL